MPFPGTHVIHPLWAERHAPVTTATMNAQCVITHGGSATWTPETGLVTDAAPQTYTGACRVQFASTQPRMGDAADQPISTRTVLVALPRGSTPQQIDARITVTAVDANGPAGIVGLTLTVTAVSPSSLAFEQDLTCTVDQTNQPGV